MTSARFPRSRRQDLVEIDRDLSASCPSLRGALVQLGVHHVTDAIALPLAPHLRERGRAAGYVKNRRFQYGAFRAPGAARMLGLRGVVCDGVSVWGPLAASVRKFTVRAEWIRLATAVVEDAMAPGGPEGIDLAVEHLPLLAGGHPSIVDLFYRLPPPSAHDTSTREGYPSTDCCGVS